MLQSVILLAALVTASLIDLRERRLPDWITLPLLALGLVVTAFSTPSDLLLNAIAAAIGFSSFWIVARLYRSLRGYDGLGLGDAKLLAAAGAWLGPLYLAPIVFLSAVLALVTVLLLRLSGSQISSQSVLPFGPFLSISFFVLWCFQLSGWTLF